MLLFIFSGACSQFGHSCFGAHGKRSGNLPYPLRLLIPYNDLVPSGEAPSQQWPSSQNLNSHPMKYTRHLTESNGNPKEQGRPQSDDDRFPAESARYLAKDAKYFTGENINNIAEFKRPPYSEYQSRNNRLFQNYKRSPIPVPDYVAKTQGRDSEMKENALNTGKNDLIGKKPFSRNNRMTGQMEQLAMQLIGDKNLDSADSFYEGNQNEKTRFPGDIIPGGYHNPDVDQIQNAKMEDFKKWVSYFVNFRNIGLTSIFCSFQTTLKHMIIFHFLQLLQMEGALLKRKLENRRENEKAQVGGAPRKEFLKNIEDTSRDLIGNGSGAADY